MLPLFEGAPARASWLSLSGTLADPDTQPAEVFRLEDEVILVVRAVCVGVKHVLKKVDGQGEPVLTRQHILTVSEAYCADDDVLRTARIAADEQRQDDTGQHRLIDGDAFEDARHAGTTMQIVDGVTGEVSPLTQAAFVDALKQRARSKSA